MRAPINIDNTGTQEDVNIERVLEEIDDKHGGAAIFVIKCKNYILRQNTQREKERESPIIIRHIKIKILLEPGNCIVLKSSHVLYAGSEEEN